MIIYLYLKNKGYLMTTQNQNNDINIIKFTDELSKIEYIAKATKLSISTYNIDEKIDLDEICYILENIQDISLKIKKDIFKYML
jgi:hypothetical protein